MLMLFAGRLASHLFLKPSFSIITSLSSSTSINSTINKLIIEESCVRQLKQILKKSNNFEECLRIDVDNGGCSGFSYVFKVEQCFDERNDVVFEKDGCKVIVDKQILPFIQGAAIEYQESLIKSSFRITNPNADQKCSCGSSFSVDLNKIQQQLKSNKNNEVH